MIYQRIIGVAAKRPRLLNPRTGIAVATSARSNGSMPDRWRVNSLRSKNAHKQLARTSLKSLKGASQLV